MAPARNTKSDIFRDSFIFHLALREIDAGVARIEKPLKAFAPVIGKAGNCVFLLRLLCQEHIPCFVLVERGYCLYLEFCSEYLVYIRKPLVYVWSQEKILVNDVRPFCIIC